MTTTMQQRNREALTLGVLGSLVAWLGIRKLEGGKVVRHRESCTVFADDPKLRAQGCTCDLRGR